MSEELGSWVIVYTNDGRYNVDAEHWDELSAAYVGWMERSINRVLSLTGRDGAEVLLAASRIGDLCRSTPETRKRSIAFELAEKAERGFQE